MVAWKCENCSWTSDRVSLDDPILHELRTGHKTEAMMTSIVAWAKVLGERP